MRRIVAIGLMAWMLASVSAGGEVLESGLYRPRSGDEAKGAGAAWLPAGQDVAPGAGQGLGLRLRLDGQGNAPRFLTATMTRPLSPDFGDPGRQVADRWRVPAAPGREVLVVYALDPVRSPEPGRYVLAVADGDIVLAEKEFIVPGATLPDASGIARPASAGPGSSGADAAPPGAVAEKGTVAGAGHGASGAGTGHDAGGAGTGHDAAVAGAGHDAAVTGAGHDAAVAGVGHDAAVAGTGHDASGASGPGKTGSVRRQAEAASVEPSNAARPDPFRPEGPGTLSAPWAGAGHGKPGTEKMSEGPASEPAAVTPPWAAGAVAVNRSDKGAGATASAEPTGQPRPIEPNGQPRPVEPAGSVRTAEQAAPTRTAEQAAPTRTVEQAGPTRVVEPAVPTRSAEQTGPARITEPTGPVRTTEPNGQPRSHDPNGPARTVGPNGQTRPPEPSAQNRSVEPNGPARTVQTAAKAPAKAAGEPAGARQALPATLHVVQTGVFSLRDNALKQVAALAKKGQRACVAVDGQGAARRYRVVIGRFADQGEAVRSRRAFADKTGQEAVVKTLTRPEWERGLSCP